jgi:hypothetical protein
MHSLDDGKARCPRGLVISSPFFIDNRIHLRVASSIEMIVAQLNTWRAWVCSSLMQVSLCILQPFFSRAGASLQLMVEE